MYFYLYLQNETETLNQELDIKYQNSNPSWTTGQRSKRALFHRGSFGQVAKWRFYTNTLNTTHTFNLKSLGRAQRVIHYRDIGYHTVSTFSLKTPPAWLVKMPVAFTQSWILASFSLWLFFFSFPFYSPALLCSFFVLFPTNAAIQLAPQR